MSLTGEDNGSLSEDFSLPQQHLITSASPYLFVGKQKIACNPQEWLCNNTEKTMNKSHSLFFLFFPNFVDVIYDWYNICRRYFYGVGSEAQILRYRRPREQKRRSHETAAAATMQWKWYNKLWDLGQTSSSSSNSRNHNRSFLHKCFFHPQIHHNKSK